jgi:hypothetical protein
VLAENGPDSSAQDSSCTSTPHCERPDYDLRKRGNENDADRHGSNTTVTSLNTSGRVSVHRSVHQTAVTNAECACEEPPAKAARVAACPRSPAHATIPHNRHGCTDSGTIDGALETQISRSALDRENGAVAGSDKQVDDANGCEAAVDRKGNSCRCESSCSTSTRKTVGVHQGLPGTIAEKHA